MTYRVEELANAAGVRVDTVRFYQTKGLLPPPQRVKRMAMYSQEHLAQLQRIRRYQSQGLSLAVIKRLLAQPGSTADALLTAVAEQSGEHSLSRAQLAAMAGMPEPLLASIEAAGLLNPVRSDGEVHYGEADLQMLRAGLEILKHGFPLHELLQLAIRHDRNVNEAADAAIDLFNRFVTAGGAKVAGAETVATAFRRLLPAVTTLAALHFQRTLLNRALARLRDRGEQEALDVAKTVVESGRLEVTWR